MLSTPSGEFLNQFLNPKSIVFYGANEDVMRTMGTIQLLNLLDNGYKGRIFPIHLKLESILGLKTYYKVSEVPEVPDLAIIILPTRVIPQIFQELGEKGVKNIVLVTAGFRESANAVGEIELKKLATQYGFRFLGPNCIGFINTHTRTVDSNEETCILNCTWVNYRTKPGNIAIASQSGTIACHTLMVMPERDMGLSCSFSVGNEANIDLCDCLEFLETDPNTDVIILYIEEIKRGRLFLELTKRISLKKPIIALYVGGTKGGAKAVASHTGSLAGNDDVYNAVFKQAGIIRVYSIEEMLDTALLFSKWIPLKILPKGDRLAIVTNAGGPGATMSDRASRFGLKMPDFSTELQEKLRKYLPPTAAASNPLDYTFSINPSVYFDSVPCLIAKSGEIDVMIAYGAFGPKFFTYQGFGKKFLDTPQNQEMMKQFMEFGTASIDASKKTMMRTGVPFIYVNLLGLEDELFQYLNTHGFVTFRMPHQAVNAVNNVIQYSLHISRYLKFLENTK